jgi:hypothetical protein
MGLDLLQVVLHNISQVSVRPAVVIFKGFTDGIKL